MIASANAKHSMLKGLVADLNAGAATLTLYDGADVLIVLSMPNPIEKSVIAAKLIIKPSEQGLIVKSGTPDRAVLSVGNQMMLDFVVGVDLILSSATVQAGGYFKTNEIAINL